MLLEFYLGVRYEWRDSKDTLSFQQGLMFVGRICNDLVTFNSLSIPIMPIVGLCSEK